MLDVQQNEMKPALTKIIWTDWPSLFLVLAIPIIWIIYFVFPILKVSAEAPILLAIAISTTSGVLLWKRISGINKLFSEGTTVAGRILAVRLAKDRGRIEYTYSTGEDFHRSWSPVHKTKKLLQLSELTPDDPIEVIYDPRKPQRSIIKDLYTS